MILKETWLGGGRKNFRKMVPLRRIFRNQQTRKLTNCVVFQLNQQRTSRHIEDGAVVVDIFSEQSEIVIFFRKRSSEGCAETKIG